MKASPRIPRSIDRFNDYITNTNTYQLTGTPDNYTRWGWTPAESADWTAFKTAFAALYAKYSDKKVSRTTDIKDQLLQIIENCARYDKEHHLLDRIGSSMSSNNTDFEKFNIKRGTPLAKTDRSIPTQVIQQQCYAAISSLGGGDMRIGCRTREDASRPSKAEGADSVRLFYKTGEPAPADSADGTKEAIFSKAGFTLRCGDGSIGKRLYIFAQWYNTKHPELAGPVSAMQTIVIGS